MAYMTGTLRSYQVDFRHKAPGQRRFHKAFSLPLADSEEAAVAKVLAYRSGETVEILGVKPA